VTTGLRGARWGLLAFLGVQMLEGAERVPGLGRLDVFVGTLAVLCALHVVVTFRRAPSASPRPARGLRLAEDLAFTLVLGPPTMLLVAAGFVLGLEALVTLVGRWGLGLLAGGAAGALALRFCRRWRARRRGRQGRG